MADLSRIVLEELRAHRLEFQSFRDNTTKRLGSLEITRAEQTGSKKTLIVMFGSSVLGALSFVVTLWGKFSGP